MLVCGLSLATTLPTFAQDGRYHDDLVHDAEVMQLIMKGEPRDASKLGFVRAEPDESGYDVQKYTIRLAPNFKKRTIDAVTTVDALATIDGLTRVDLDFVGLTITQVTVGGQQAAYDRSNRRTLSVTLPAPVALGGDSFAPSPYWAFLALSRVSGWAICASPIATMSSHISILGSSDTATTLAITVAIGRSLWCATSSSSTRFLCDALANFPIG